MNNSELAALRESYYSIAVGPDDAGRQEPVWVKKLRIILNNDIHNKSLGCRISDTHIKIGTGAVHMGAFFEAQLLFSHSKWVNRFALWLKEQLDKNHIEKPCLIVGYETYVEPVLAILQSLHAENVGDVHYCIFEEAKGTTKKQISTERLRYLDNTTIEKPFSSVVFLCGISTTLRTHEKMQKTFLSTIENIRKKNQIKKNTIPVERKENHYFFSFVQVLAQGERHFQIEDVFLEWDKYEKTIKAEKSDRTIKVEYLVDVEAKWQKAEQCSWCFPDNVLSERPLITTGSTAIIPVQRIGTPPERHQSKGDRKPFSAESKVLFKRHQDSFSCQDYLYYNHIERGNHHYRYYLRTGSFFDYVRNQKVFRDYCQSIRNSLVQNWQENMHIIIAPLHFSNDRFPQEINRLVFDSTAHIIAFDTRNEFRSNFETKYSSYAYALEQLRGIRNCTGDGNKTIYFHFVDDEIVTGATFFRAKSFVLSLMRKYVEEERQSFASNPETAECKTDAIETVFETKPNDIFEPFKVFASVITLIDRCSDSTKRNYVSDLKDFHHFIHFAIPNLRTYGDSCPICEQIEEAKKVESNCCLNSTAQFWVEKQNHWKLLSLQEAKLKAQTTEQENPEDYLNKKKRHFRRMFCENLLWDKTKHLWDEDEIGKMYFRCIFGEIRHKTCGEQYEYLISFIKAFSRPALFYKEGGKKAAMKMLLALIEEIITYNQAGPLLPAKLALDCAKKFEWETGREGTVDTDDDGNRYISEQYSLICVIISCLSEIGSNYLLNVENIEKLCKYVAHLDKTRFCQFNQVAGAWQEEPGFYTVIVNNYKRVICRPSGKEKTRWGDAKLWRFLKNNRSSERSELYRVLFLENIQKTGTMGQAVEDEKAIDRFWKTEANSHDTIKKYFHLGEALSKDICSKADCTFFAQFKDKIIELSEHVRLRARFSAEVEKTLNQLGFYQDREVTWVVFQPAIGMTSKDENVNRASANEIIQVLLQIRFTEDVLENLFDVRSIMIHRAEIMQMIQSDLENGALMAAIQAQAAEQILLTDKTQSHGQSADINELLRLVYDRFISVQNNEEEWIKTLRYIHLFMNRCIAYGGTKIATRQYFPIDEERIELVPFVPGVQPLANDSRVEDCKRIKRYLDTLNEEKYSKSIKNDIWLKHDNHQYGAENVTIEITNAQALEKVKYVPFLVNTAEPQESASRSNSSSVRAETSQNLRNKPIVLIGLIDLLVRNAIEHGEEDCHIIIRCQTGESCVPEQDKKEPDRDYSESYSITVENEIREVKKTSVGFTQLFLTEYLKRNCPISTSYFSVVMGPKENDPRLFQAKLTCVVMNYRKEG